MRQNLSHLQHGTSDEDKYQRKLKFSYRTRLSVTDYLWKILNPRPASLCVFLACRLFQSHFFLISWCMLRKYMLTFNTNIMCIIHILYWKILDTRAKLLASLLFTILPSESQSQVFFFNSFLTCSCLEFSCGFSPSLVWLRADCEVVMNIRSSNKMNSKDKLERSWSRVTLTWSLVSRNNLLIQNLKHHCQNPSIKHKFEL